MLNHGPLATMAIAILVDTGFDQSNLFVPRHALDYAGAQTDIIAPVRESMAEWDRTEIQTGMDVKLHEADPKKYDALLLPLWVTNLSQMWKNPQVTRFVRAFSEAMKPIAAICHGPRVLMEVGAARGRRMTSWPALKNDLENAGAIWVDAAVIVDGNLLTSRNADDLPEFNRAMINLFFRHSGRLPAIHSGHSHSSSG